MTDRPGSPLCKNFPPSFLEILSPLPMKLRIWLLLLTLKTPLPVCRACYYHLKYFRRICKFLSVETAVLLANSMISSRIDYCNSLLYGVNKYNMAQLQKIQNVLCRNVFRLDKTSYDTSYLQKLHWLPFHTVSCSNTLLLHSRLSNSPNPHTYHP